MFGGMGSTVGAGDQAFRDARFVLDLCQLVTDKEAVASQIRQWVEARNKLEIARAEAVKAEQAVAHREQQAAKHQQALEQREQAIVEKERALEALAQRVEERKAEIDALRDDLRKAWAA
jgi:chromosome segregation ATPase